MRTRVILLGWLVVIGFAGTSVWTTEAPAQQGANAAPAAGQAPAAGEAPAAGQAPAAGEAPAADKAPQASSTTGEVQVRRAVKKPGAGKGKPPPIPNVPPLVSVPSGPDPEIMHFAGTCGASAAIRMDRGRIIVGSDDDNFLRTYDLVEAKALAMPDSPGRSLLHKPRSEMSLYEFLDVNIRSRRNDSAIEGATVGDGITYWIGAHSRRDDGESRPNRRRLFAMQIETKAGVSILQPYGAAVTTLAQQLDADPKMTKAGLRNSIMAVYRRLEHLAPEARGLDIQALAMAPDRRTLWLALRNPLRGRSAVLIPIENPLEVVNGAEAVIGDPIELGLDGRGISAIEWVPKLREYLIVSGEVGKSDGYRLHRWSGERAAKPTAGVPLPEGLNVQAFVVSEDGKRALLVSDDSDLMIPVDSPEWCKRKYADGACPCDLTRGPGAKRFRTRWVSLETPGG